MVDQTNLETVRAFLKNHKEEIIKRYQAEGVAIGKEHPDDKDYVIVVYLHDAKQKPNDPVILDNIKLKFEVTGSFILHR